VSVTCLSCGHTLKGNFCSNCGQKASVKRLTAAVLFEETIHSLTHLESGFLYTSWNLLLRPGLTGLNYIKGKRKVYQKPVSFFIIWTGLYILLHNAIINHFDFQIESRLVAQLNIGEQSNVLFRQHFTLFIIPVIAYSAFLLYILLSRPKYNYIEILTLSLFGAGTYFMLSLISDLFIAFFLKVNILTANVFLWQGILSSLYNFWFSYDFFKRMHLRFFWIRLISVSILIAIGGWLIMFYLPMLWMSFSI
jgi:hypothetical protein